MRIFLPFLAVLFLLGGCSNPSAPPRPFRTKFYQTVVSLSPGITEIVLSTNSAMLLRGRTSADNFPPTAVNNIPVVASTKPDYEKLKELGPDLILYDSDLYSDADIAKLKTLGADMYAVDGKTVDAFIGNLYDIGSKIGAESNINDYVERIHVAVNTAEAIPWNPVPKVMILMPGEGGSEFIDGTGSFLADAVKCAGGKLVGPDSTRFVPASPESLLSYDPDVIIVPGSKDNFKGAEEIANNPHYQAMRAIKAHNLKVLDQDILLRRGQRVDQLITGLHTAIGETVKSQ